MHKKKLLCILLLSLWINPVTAQELTLSTVAKTYSSDEQIWVNLSVLNADAFPGAYKIGVTFATQKVKFLGILPADKGPFTTTPAASVSSDKVTVAGFQGITDNGSGVVSLATLIFTPVGEAVALDTSAFSVNSKEIYTTQAQPISVTVKKITTSVLLPSSQRMQQQPISFTNGYIRFTVKQDGITTVRILDLHGRTIALPLKPGLCKAGVQAVPIGTELLSGMYIVTVTGVGLDASRKMEVVR